MNQALHTPLSVERLYTIWSDVKNLRNVRRRGCLLNKSCALRSLCWSPTQQLCMRKRHHVAKASVPFGCFSPQGKTNKSKVLPVHAVKACSGRS
jgi:hypothetical protein